MQETAVTAANIVALASGFRSIIRGAEGRPATWSPERLGSLRAVVYRDDGLWHPDALTRSRVLLQQVISSFDPVLTPLTAPKDVAYTRSVVARYWGVSTFPTDPALDNPFLERGIDQESDDEVSLTEASPDTTPERDDEAQGVATVARRAQNWARRIAKFPAALAVAAAGSQLDPVELDLEYWSTRGASVGIPRWSTAPDQVERWPPGLMPGEEGHWLLERLGAFFDEEDPRLVSALDNPNARRRQLTQVLRRRATELHDEYLGEYFETQPHFFHLRHSMARQWFETDLEDLGGVAERYVAFRELEESSQRQAMLRSQAAIAQLMFFTVLHEWNPAAVDEILDRRSSARLLFLGGDELAHPLERLIQRIEDDRRRKLQKGVAPKLTRKALPVDPVFVSEAGPKARELFRASQDVRESTTRETVQRYIDLRRHVQESEAWGRLSIHDKRTVLLADHAVHLDAVKLQLPAVMGILDQFLETSSRARSEYAAFIERDVAMLAGKSNTRRGLEDSVAAARRGVEQIESASFRADSQYSPSQFNERAAMETTHQMSLALAGATVKVLEDLMEAPADEQATFSTALLLNRIRSAVRWSRATLSALDQLERAGYLGSTRYDDGFLAVAGWRVASKVIRHRILCASFALVEAFDLRDQLAFPRVLDLEVAYVEMITEPAVVEGNIPTIVQGALLHSFLTHGELPFPGRIAPAAKRSDYLTMDVDSAAFRHPRVQWGVGRRMRATIANSEADYDYGVVGRVPLSSRTARTLNALSGGGYSEWRRFVEVRQIQRDQPERNYAYCYSCGYAGPTDPQRRHSCPRCGDIVAV
jgi:hypothetical protein